MGEFLKLLHASFEGNLHRLNSRLRGSGRSLELSVEAEEDDANHYLRLRAQEEKATLIIPRLRKNQYGNWVIGDRNDRAMCPFMLVLDRRPEHMTYDKMVLALLSRNIEELYPQQGKKNFVDRILWSFFNNRGRLTVGLCQRFLNLNLFNSLPLSGTPMQDWAMNRRLMIFDPIFGMLRPNEKLEYQRRKNEMLYPWGSIGLSDGAAATNNYILQEDLRKYSAFGLRHHNPIRNLYSTLGMKGEEKPWVVSSSAAVLEEKGVGRLGWNWMTAFLDLPLNFEDQILVSKKHAGKQVSGLRSFTLFGEETVNVGERILKGRILGVNEDENQVVFDIDCDHASVVEIKDGVVPFDGKDQPVRLVVLQVVYSLKEGFKITNQHGNKGIIRLMDLGRVYDGTPGGTEIDVIVSAQSVQKRKNFGQVLEAMATMTSEKDFKGGERIIVSDDCEVSIEDVRMRMEIFGKHSENGTFEVETPWGKFDTLAGYVHWGVTKTPEEQLWQGSDTWEKNQKGLRTRGNKISTIELKALTTLFGPKSKVVKEILSHQQGADEVQQLLWILRGMSGDYLENLPVVPAEAFVYLPAGLGTFHTEERLVGTVADEEMYPRGCYLQLPFSISVMVPNDRFNNEIVEGISSMNAYQQLLKDPDWRIFETNRIMLPAFELRQPWRHATGKFGMSDISTLLNQIIEGVDRLKHKEIKPEQLSALVFRYFHMISSSLSLKTGKISNYLMAVRYPWSSKATATLGNDLEPNWVEIHKKMAVDLKVKTGDYVLVERFPCLGFMSTRIQRVKVTDDPECEFVIRVSGNSLVSMNLDFDGDVLYIMSFHDKGSKEELRSNFHNPHPRILEVLEEMNNRKQQITATVDLDSLGLQSFQTLSPQEHADLNALSLAVKVWTGPVIALCYGLMRIVEGNISYHDREGHINVEVFLDKVGNSVFSQKHGTKSLREECIEAVCLADEKALVELGFPERESHQLCSIIRQYAREIGLRGQEALEAHYQRHLEEGRSNIINTIVRRFHRAYFATRANLHPIDLLQHIADEPRDLVGHLIHPHVRVDGEDEERPCRVLEKRA